MALAPSDGALLKIHYTDLGIIKEIESTFLSEEDVPTPEKEGYKFIQWDTITLNGGSAIGLVIKPNERIP